MTCQQHLEWCKKRALEYVDNGDTTNAFASMASDLQKHPETSGHAGMMLGTRLLVAGRLSASSAMREFIEDFN